MSRVKRVFTREFMEENDYPYDFIHREFVESHRWYDVWSGVFEFEGKFYETTYMEPSTEMQEEDTWNGDDEIVATQVVLLPVVRKEWVPVDV